MGEKRTYAGGCHCGAVRYEAETDLASVITCNCSICTKRGLMLNFVPRGAFRLTKEGETRDYQFNKHVIHHMFCTGCGVESFAYGALPNGVEMVALNVRCLDGVDLPSLTLTPYDGASR